MKIKFRTLIHKFDELENREYDIFDSLFKLEGQNVMSSDRFLPSTTGGEILNQELKKIREIKKSMLEMPCDIEGNDFIGIF